jgi:hypothetical protein
MRKLSLSTLVSFTVYRSSRCDEATREKNKSVFPVKCDDGRCRGDMRARRSKKSPRVIAAVHQVESLNLIARSPRVQ